jgi:hypothetical protein
MRSIPKVGKGWSVAGLAVVALVVAGAIQASVGGGTDDEATTVARDMPAGTAMAPGMSSGEGSPMSDVATSGKGEAQISPLPPDGGTTAVVPGSPRVVRSADLRVKVVKGRFGVAFDQVASLAAANGGFVSSSSTSSNEDARSGELTVRVPADRFDSVRQSLGALGEVESQAIRGEDVSGQLVDFDARLKSLRAQEDSLRVLVGQAKEVGDVLQVQSSLFTVRQQIEQLAAQKANLEQATTLATLHVSLFEPGAVPGARPLDDGPSLAHSFEQAADGMLAVVGGMIVVVGYVIPLAVLGLLGCAGSRVLRRRPAPQVPTI